MPVDSDQLWRDPELRALGTALLLVTLLLWWLGQLAPVGCPGPGGIRPDQHRLLHPGPGRPRSAAKLVLILSMVTGGGVGSTAGGMKLLRVLILIRVIQLAILRVQIPRHGVVQAELEGGPWRPAQIEHALLVLLLYPLVIVLSWLPFLAAGYPPLDALFEVVSAVGTVGLSMGITGPELETGLKLLLSLDMLLGRLEILALLVLAVSWHLVQEDLNQGVDPCVSSSSAAGAWPCSPGACSPSVAMRSSSSSATAP